ncbi:hypothetical protein AV656_13670 [Bhargavaea cecembensis]|uniref:Uncharacterized protein n=1 Tax=Bhargavaea cecembensis TaxID=394098 RepID=A0A163ENU3_9BACL|nr:hypothetical protein [Bhargavaea cecembensis]KZE36827.1 hypothetical protein AV656_13670 [Bhargavaea cecembensis]
MKLRKGRYAKWNGRDYELASYQRIYYLTTEDPSLADEGFTPQEGRPGRYIREVSVKELEDAYEIIPYTIYKSHRFTVEGETKDGKLVMVTSDPYVRNDMNVKPYGRHEFIIEASPEEVDLAEECKGILGFDGQSTNCRKFLK